MATFGKCDDGSQDDGIPSGYMYGPMLTMPEDGDITKVSAKVRGYAASPADKGKVGIYDDGGDDEPDILLDTSQENTSITGVYAWLDFTYSPAYTATKDVKYHLQVFCNGDFNLRANSSGGATNFKSGNIYPTFPNPYPIPTGSNSHEVCVCVYYTPAVVEEENPLISKPLVSPLIVSSPIIRSFKNRFPKFRPRLVA